MAKRPIGSFLANSSRRTAWLDKQRATLEADGAQISHWGNGQHLGIALTGMAACGEFHLHSDGSVSSYAEARLGNTIMNTEARVSDEGGFEEQFISFVKTVLHYAPH